MGRKVGEKKNHTNRYQNDESGWENNLKKRRKKKTLHKKTSLFIFFFLFVKTLQKVSLMVYVWFKKESEKRKEKKSGNKFLDCLVKEKRKEK